MQGVEAQRYGLNCSIVLKMWPLVEGALYFTWQHPKVDCSPFSLVLQAKEQIGNRTYVNPLVHFVCEGKVQVSFLTDNVVR